MPYHELRGSLFSLMPYHELRSSFGREQSQAKPRGGA
jgi:hypothetical protein